jgi:hemoglobin
MSRARTPSLYEWMGGAEVIEKLVTTFYQKTLTDPLLKPFFEHMPPEHIHNVALWFGEIFGGPKAYSHKYGKTTAHPHMMSQHLNLRITEEQRKRWVELMQETADEIGLPDDPEFRAAFAGYLEWGTRIAKIVSRPGTKLPKEDPMPKWGWGEQKPSQ